MDSIFKIHVPGAVWNFAESARYRLFEMHCNQMSFSDIEVFQHICLIGMRGICYISDIRVYIQITGTHQGYIFHCLFHGVHKLIFHRLKSQKHTGPFRHIDRLLQICQKSLFRFQAGFFVVYVITCELYDPDSQVIRKLYRFLHNLHTPAADLRVTASEGVFPVPAQAHGADRYSSLCHQTDQLQPLLAGHFQSAQLLIGLVYTDLHKIISGTFCSQQLFFPR